MEPNANATARSGDTAPIRTGPAATLLAWLFAATIFGVPLGQAGFELATGQPVQALDYLHPFVALRAATSATGATDPAAAPLGFGERLRALGRDLTSADRLRAFEKKLHDVSFVKRAVLPWYRLLLAGGAHQGTKEAAVGRDGWLFYGDDLLSAFGRGFLAPGVGGVEALDAITDFRDQLAARGVKLLLLPSYSKEMLDPARIGTATAHLDGAANPDLERFYAELARRQIDFVRMDEVFAACRKAGATGATAADGLPAPLGLPRDTHWSPATMQFAAGRIAARARDLLGELDAGPPQIFVRQPVDHVASGDLVRMLGVPATQSLYPPMHFTLAPVAYRTTGELVKPDPTSEVLLLGDSLSNVFSNPALGMGEAAGLPEQLAFELDRPIDVIALDGKSATGVREALARRPGGLDGKQLVIWQFGVRMLALGPAEWRKVELPAPRVEGAVDPATVTDAASPVTVVGELVEATRIDPAKFDYAFCLGVMEFKVEQVVAGTLAGDRAWVAVPILDHHEATAANGWPLGTRLRLELEDVRRHYDLEKVSWGDQTEAGKVIYFAVKSEPAPRK